MDQPVLYPFSLIFNGNIYGGSLMNIPALHIGCLSGRELYRGTPPTSDLISMMGSWSSSYSLILSWNETVGSGGVLGGCECILHRGRIRINLWPCVDCGFDLKKLEASLLSLGMLILRTLHHVVRKPKQQFYWNLIDI